MTAHRPSSERQDKSRRPWLGIVLSGTAMLHIAFVSVMLGSRWIPNAQVQQWVGDRTPLLMLTPGVGSQQPANLLLLTLFWSLAFGVTLLLAGALLHALEQRCEEIPKRVGVLLLLLCSVGALLIPLSGFWFGLIPSLVILKPRRASAAQRSERA